MSDRDDHEVRAAILAALESDQVDPFGIDVEVRDGEVVLSGVVSSHSERLRAHGLARDLAKAGTVVDHLTVRPLGSDWRLTPDEISAGVEQELRDSGVPHTGVGFTITDRLVTLTGTVPDHRTRSLLRHLVQKSPGVHFVDNRIQVAAATSARTIA